MSDEHHDERVSPAASALPWRTRVAVGLRDAVTLASVVWLSCFVVLGGFAWWSNDDGIATCPVLRVDEVRADAGGGSASTAGQLPKLEPTADRPATVSLGRARAVRTARTSLTVAAVSADEAVERDASTESPTTTAATPDPPPSLDDVTALLPLEVRINPFVREDGATLRQSVRERSVRGDGGRETQLLTAHAFSRRGVVTVELCVDRDGVAIGHPGRYEGSVTVVDPRVVSTDVPFVVAMAYPNAALIALLTVVAVAVAAIYSWRVHYDGSTAEEAIRFGQFFAWLRSWAGLLAVASGSVAAYVAYSATYLSNAVWGTSVTQFTAIVGAVFTAFVTAATTIIAGSRTRRPNGGGEDERDGKDNGDRGPASAERTDDRTSTSQR